jgi:hypothetical protein
VGVLLVGAVALGACSSSSAPKQTPVGSTTPSTPPSSSASSTPAPSSSPSKTVPLSPFEDDPAVKALRTWANQAAKTVNTGKYDDASLNKLMTPAFAKTMKVILGGEVKYRYPGPVPFLPISVSVVSPTVHNVKACFVTNGFSLNRRTGKPAETFKLHPIDTGAQLVSGVWLVSHFYGGTFSCSSVRVPRPTW